MLNRLLKPVSRSFYLSIRILPAAIQQSISLAYLLARAADSIADSEIIAINEKQNALSRLKNLLCAEQPSDIAEIVVLGNQLTNPNERILLNNLDEIVVEYLKLSKDEKKLVANVVTTLINGMEWDLTTFNDQKNITALKSINDLDHYTYLVAGCVGEFWTEILMLHSSSLAAHWDKTEQVKHGIAFGKALQLTNIMRDIAKDAQIGRCYTPGDLLAKYGLQSNEILQPDSNQKFQPVISELTKQAIDKFESAENYLLATPRTCIRLRLAALWPILIGLETLKLISKKTNYLDPTINVKVKRRWVYKVLLLSVPAIISNSIIHNWINRIKSKIKT